MQYKARSLTEIRVKCLLRLKMPYSEENLVQSKDSVVENVIEAIRNMKRKHGGQCLENVSRECEKSFC